MAKRLRIELNHDGMDALLKSPGVMSALEDEAESVRAAAQASAPDHPSGAIEYFAGSHIGQTRAMAFVVGKHVMGAYLERKYRILGKALKGLGSGG